MSNKFIKLNGTNFYPTSIELSINAIGELKRAANGAARYYLRANKRAWAISWTGLPESQLAAIRTIGLLMTTFTFQDEFGATFTVVVTPGGFTQSMSADKISRAGIIYYDVTLNIEEV